MSKSHRVTKRKTELPTCVIFDSFPLPCPLLTILWILLLPNFTHRNTKCQKLRNLTSKSRRQTAQLFSSKMPLTSKCQCAAPLKSWLTCMSPAFHLWEAENPKMWKFLRESTKQKTLTYRLVIWRCFLFHRPLSTIPQTPQPLKDIH